MCIRDRLLRSLAEIENQRRRAEKEIKEFVRDLINNYILTKAAYTTKQSPSVTTQNFNGNNSYLFNPYDENGDEMFQGYDTSQNNGDGGSSTVLNYTCIEKGSPEHYVPLLVKIDSDGNTLQSIDLENSYF